MNVRRQQHAIWVNIQVDHYQWKQMCIASSCQTTFDSLTFLIELNPTSIDSGDSNHNNHLHVFTINNGDTSESVLLENGVNNGIAHWEYSIDTN